MMLQTDAILAELSQLTDEWVPAKDVLTLLHCTVSTEGDDEVSPQLDLGQRIVSFRQY
jgi:hypothetical protein